MRVSWEMKNLQVMETIINKMLEEMEHILEKENKDEKFKKNNYMYKSEADYMFENVPNTGKVYVNKLT